ncbi:MAG: hypothetical protein J6P21_00745 [Clostridia bacterium]|nr:hypothetical protein [Clostridia bacterium]
MRKSIKNKIAIMLALFGAVSQKTHANNYTGWIVGGVTALGLGLGIGISGYYLFGGKSKDENNKVKSQEQQNLEQSIKDFLDSLPKDNKRLPSYLVFDNPIGDVGKVGCFWAAEDIFKQYVLKHSGGKCVSSQEDLNNNKLLIMDPAGRTDVFVLENKFKLKIQLAEYMGHKQVSMTVSRPSRNPNQDDPLKNKIKSILDNGELANNKGDNLDKLKRFYNQAYDNNGYYQFDENVLEKNAVAIVKYDFDVEDNDDPEVVLKTTYKFILESDERVKIKRLKFITASKEEKVEYENVVQVS